MTKLLTEAEIAKYRKDGYVFPIRVMPEAEATGYERRLQAIEAREGGAMSHRTNMKPHLLVPWLNQLMRHPKILDAVEDVIGPNILAWSSGFFTKGANDPNFVSWHQDSTYWGLSEPDVVTAWVAFTASTIQSGCMRVIPGSHDSQVEHNDTYGQGNMLSRGQEVMVEVDESKAVDIQLKPGEISLHHVRIIHGSPPNRADHRRIGYAIRYIPTYVRQLSPMRDSATLVRGVDEHRNFDLDPVPKAEFDADAVAYHASVVERQTKILYAGAKKMRDLNAPAARAM
ncbi:MAG: phytanoyl-CoA dioxygenase family protein [Proteobacteria bacterium]|nr:phytanoyl-CoA dioxygenase family protein [Pseudomonadota bacterium]